MLRPTARAFLQGQLSRRVWNGGWEGSAQSRGHSRPSLVIKRKPGAWRPVRQSGARSPARLGSAGPSRARKAASSFPPAAQGLGCRARGQASAAQAGQVATGRPRGLRTTLPSMQRAKSGHSVPTAPRQELLGLFIDLGARSRSDPLGSPRGPAPFGEHVTSLGPASCVLCPLLVVQPGCQSGARGRGRSLIGGLRLAPTRKGSGAGRRRVLGSSY